jgi:hypothetical protein
VLALALMPARVLGTASLPEFPELPELPELLGVPELAGVAAPAAVTAVPKVAADASARAPRPIRCVRLCGMTVPLPSGLFVWRALTEMVRERRVGSVRQT